MAILLGMSASNENDGAAGAAGREARKFVDNLTWTLPVCPRFAPNENDVWVALGQTAWKTERPVKRNGHYIYDTCARTLPACLLGVPLEFAPESPKMAALGTARGK